MSRVRSYKMRLPVGVVDAGFASLATFAAGLAAVNLLGDAERGVYAVFFAAFMLGTVLPRSLIFTPAEVRAVASPVDASLMLLPRSLFLGVGPAVLGVTAILVAVPVTAPHATSEVILALALTSGVATILSPLQDHVRRMFHIAARSWQAAAVSIVQFVSVLASIGVMLLLEVDAEWVPFGTLAVANAVSLTISRLISGTGKPFVVPERLSPRLLASGGKWLLVKAAATWIMGFAAATIIIALAGPEVLGFAESARIVAQPILVLATGLTAVLAPRSIKAGMDRDLRTARRTSRAYLWLIGIAGIGYLAITGWDWFLNPMSYIVPSAYVVPGLVALTVVANILSANTYLQESELLGARRERTLARIAWTASPVLLLGGLTAGITGAYARPLGRLGAAATEFVMHGTVLRGMYQREPETGSDAAPTQRT